MKPFQIIVIVVFGLLAILGLYVFATFSGFGGNASAVGSVTIWGTLPQSAFDTALSTLTRTDKSYTNVKYIQKPAENFDAALANALASGAGPDLAVITQEQLLTEESKLSLTPFSSLPERTFLDSYPAIDELYLTQTGTYGIPLAIDPLVMYYNRSLLSSAGVSTPPSTWEAVTGLVPSIVKQDANQRIQVAALPFGSYANVTNARAIMSLLFFQAGSPISTVAAQGMRSALSLGSESASTGNTGAEAALNFYTQFADPSRTVYTWSPSFTSSRNAFIAGSLGLYFGYASEEADIAASNPNLDFDMARVPQSAGASSRSTYGLAYAFVIPKIATNKAGAWSVAMALTAPGVLQTFATNLAMAPASRPILAIKPADRYASIYYPEALSARGWLSPLPVDTDRIFSAMIQNVISGRMAATNALQAADQSLNAILAN